MGKRGGPAGDFSTTSSLPAPHMITAGAAPAPRRDLVGEGPTSPLLLALQTEPMLGTSMVLSPAGKQPRSILVSHASPESRRSLFGGGGGGGGGQRETGDIEDIAGTQHLGTGGIGVAHVRVRKSVHFTPPAVARGTPSAMEAFDVNGGEAEVLTMDEETADDQRDDGVETADGDGGIQKRPGNENLTPEVPGVVALRRNKIETRVDFEKWLSKNKERWDHMRSARKSERGMLNQRGSSGRFSDSMDVGTLRKASNMDDFARQSQRAADFNPWQILELREMENPGEFVVYAMTSRLEMQQLKLTIPRTIIINCLRGSKVDRTLQTLPVARKIKGPELPHSHKVLNLYELQVEERKYQQLEKTLALLFNDSSVEGVYETKTPLWLRAVLKAGCVARVARGYEGKARAFYDLSALQGQLDVSEGYLDSTSAVYRRIFLYCAMDKNRQGGIGGVGLFILDGTNADVDELYGDVDIPPMSGKVYFWLGNGGSLDSRPPLKRLYRKFQPDERSNLLFSTNIVPSMVDAFRACGERLAAYLRDKRGPTVVVAQGTMDSKQVHHVSPYFCTVK